VSSSSTKHWKKILKKNGRRCVPQKKNTIHSKRRSISVAFSPPHSKNTTTHTRLSLYDLFCLVFCFLDHILQNHISLYIQASFRLLLRSPPLIDVSKTRQKDTFSFDLVRSEQARTQKNNLTPIKKTGKLHNHKNNSTTTFLCCRHEKKHTREKNTLRNEVFFSSLFFRGSRICP